MAKYKYLDWIAKTPTLNLYYTPTSNNIDNVNYRRTVIPTIYCKDGAYVSVQASSGHYCSPRKDYGNWYEFECGFPSVIPPIEWKKYAEEWSKTPKQKLHNFYWGIRVAVSAAWKYGKKRDIVSAFLHGWRREWHRLIHKTPCNTIYAYMPINVVKKFIIAHGGEDSKEVLIC